jgi:3'-5' exoribonuclease
MDSTKHAPSTTTQQGPQRKFIEQLGAPEFVKGVFAISNTQMGQTRQGKPYLRCIISDKTGEMPGRMWSIEEAVFRKLPTEGFAYVEGETQPYQGELQFIIHLIEPAEPSPDQLTDLLPTTAKNIDEMFARVQELLGTLAHPAAKALAGAYLADQYLMDAFRRCPAAKSMHHAYLGGLLEHTLSVMELADRICPNYPRISRDLVLLGLFLHDLGKTRELIWDRTFGYSDRGELIGHIVDGALMLQDRAHAVMREQSMRFPPGFVTVLQHIILSHHGQPEFGAAKHPATPEALLVSMIDNLDAKTAMALQAARPERANALDLQGSFTEKQWALDGVKLYKRDPLA